MQFGHYDCIAVFEEDWLWSGDVYILHSFSLALAILDTLNKALSIN